MSEQERRRVSFFHILTFLIALLSLAISILTLAILFKSGIVTKDSLNFAKIQEKPQSVKPVNLKQLYDEETELLQTKSMLVKAKIELESNKSYDSAKEWAQEASKALDNLNKRAQDKFVDLKSDSEDLLVSIKSQAKDATGKISKLIDKINILTGDKDKKEEESGNKSENNKNN